MGKITEKVIYNEQHVTRSGRCVRLISILKKSMTKKCRKTYNKNKITPTIFGTIEITMNLCMHDRTGQKEDTFAHKRAADRARGSQMIHY